MRYITLIVFVLSSLLLNAQQNSKSDSLDVLIRNSSNQTQKQLLLLQRSKALMPSAINESYNDAIAALEIAKSENNTTAQLESLTQLSAVFFVKENFQKAIEFDVQVLKLSEKINNNLGKINAYKSISRNEKALGNIKESVLNAEKAKEIAVENKLNQELASINNALGVAYRNNNDFQKSLNVLDEGLTQTKSKKLIALLKMNKANTLTEMMRLDDAIENHLASLVLFEELKDSKGQQQVYNNLGTLFKKAKQYDKASYYIHKSLKISVANNAKGATATGYDNLANVNDLAKKKDSIVWFRKKAISLFEAVDDQKNAARSYHNLGNYYLLHNQLNEAERNLLIALQKRIKINVPQDIAVTKTELGVLYDKLEQFDKAEIYLNEAKLALKDVISDKKEDFLKAYSEHYRLKGELDTALKIKEEQLDLKDSLLHSTEIINVIKKENEYQTNSQNQKIIKLQTVEEKLLKGKVIYGILLFLVFLLALYSFVRWKKSDQNKKQLQLEKQTIETVHQEVAAALVDEKRKTTIAFIELKNKTKVYLKDLVYLKAEDHYVELYTTTKTEIVRESLKKVAESLPPNFIRCHKSYIVNTNFVKSSNTKEFLMTNGLILPRSRTYS